MADYPEIAELFDTDFREDPYSAFTSIFREASSAALANQGSMNQYELNTIKFLCVCLWMADADSGTPTVNVTT